MTLVFNLQAFIYGDEGKRKPLYINTLARFFNTFSTVL